MTDERDIRRPKTPPVGVRLQTAGEQKWEDKTHPGMPLEERLDVRTRHISEAVIGVPQRLQKLEEHNKAVVHRLDQQDVAIGKAQRDAAYTRGKIDAIAENAIAQQQERAEKREHDLAKLKLTTIAKVVGAVLGAIGTALAAYLGLR